MENILILIGLGQLIQIGLLFSLHKDLQRMEENYRDTKWHVMNLLNR